MIQDEIMRMDADELVALRSAINERIERIKSARRQEVTARWETLAGYMETICGYDIRQKCRLRVVTNARYLVFLKMQLEGYTQKDMERASGFDHSTVCYGSKAIADALKYPRIYPEVAQMDKELTKMMDDEKDMEERQHD